MTSVDNRVVKMEFDNAQFEKGVSQSIQSLKNLDSSLKFKNGATGFEQIQAAADKLSFGKAKDEVTNFADKVKSSVPEIAAELMSLSGVAAKVVAGITALAPVALGMAGGWSRALKIDNAKFSLKGLGVEWEDIAADINYGVADTAYGLDAAASAAANLVASNVQLGDDMKMSLRGISGLAAMTNSEYEEIAHIITTIAGNGRVMTEQLRQFSNRGLNAAAALAEQLGKTEEEIYQMVTKGDIDFMTFMKAMDDKFGEHAKKANDTYNGAIANLKAALSKIGALFAEPIQHFLRDMANTFRPFINLLKDALQMPKELFDLAGNSLGEMSIVSSFIYNIEHLRDAIMNTMQAFLANEDAVANFKRLFVQLNSVFDLVFHAVMKLSSSFVYLFDKVFTQFLRIDFSPVFDLLVHFVYETIDLLAIELGCIGDILGLVMDAIADVIGALSPAIKVIGGIIETVLGGALMTAFHIIRWITYAIKLIAEGINGFTNSLAAISVKPGSVIGTLVSGLKGIKEALGFANDMSLLDTIGKAITDFMQAVGSVAVPAFGGIINILDALIGFAMQVSATIFSDVAKSIKEFVDSITGLINIPNPFESLVPAQFDGQALANVLNDIGNTIRFLTDQLRLFGVEGFVKWVDILLKSKLDTWFKDLSPFVTSAKAAFNNFLNTASDIASKIVDPLVEKFPFLGEAIQTVSSFAEEASKTFSDLFQQLKDFLSANIDFSSVTGTLESFGAAIHNFASGIVENFSGFIGDIFGPEASNAVLEAANAIDSFLQKIQDLGGMLGGVGDKVSEFFGNFTEAKEDLEQITGTVSTVASTVTGMTKSTTSGSNRPNSSKPVWRDPETGQYHIGFPPKETAEGTQEAEKLVDKIPGLSEETAEAAQQMNVFSASLSNAKDALAEVGLHVVQTASAILHYLGQAAAFVLDGISSIAKFVSEFVGGLTAYNSAADAVAEKVPIVTKAFKKTGEAAEEASGTSGFDGFLESVKGVADSISDFVKPYLNFETVMKAISAAVSGFMLGITGKTLLGLTDFVDSIKSLPKTLNDVIGSFNLKELTGLGQQETKIQQITKMLISFAIAIAALAGAAFLLSHIPGDDLAKASFIIIGFIFTMVRAFDALMVSMKSLKDIAGMKGNIIALSVALIAMSGAVFTLALAAGILSLIPPDKLLFSSMVIVGFIMALAKASEIMGKAEANVLKAAGSIAILAVALNLLMVPIVAFGLMPWGIMLKGIGTVAVIMLGLAGLAKALTKTEKQFVQAAGAIAILAVALNLLMVPIMVFAVLPLEMIGKGVAAVGVLMTVLALMSRVITKESKQFIEAAGAIAIVAAAINLLVAPIIMLGMAIEAMPAGVTGAIFGLMVMIGMLAVALEAISNKNAYAAGAALAVASFGLITIAGAIAILAAVPFEAALGGLVILGLALVGLGVAAKILSPMAAEIWVLSVSVLALGAGVGLAGIGMTLFASGLVTLAAVLPTVASAFVTAVGIMVEPIANLATEGGKFIAEFIDSLVTSIAERIESIKQGAATLISGFADGVTMSAGSVAMSGVNLVISFLGGIASKIGDIINQAVNIIVNFIGGIASNLGRIIDSGIQLITAFVSGIGRGLAQNREAITGAFWDLLSGVGSLLLEFLASIVEKIPGVGPMAAEKIRALADDIAPAAEEVGEAYADDTIDAIKNGTDEVGEVGNQEMADSLEEHAAGQYDGAGEAAADGFSGSFMDKIKSMDFSGGLFENMPTDGANLAGLAAGESYGEGQIEGIENEEQPVVGAAESISASAGQIDSASDGETAGGHFGAGMLVGIENYRERIVAKAEQIAAEANEGVDRTIGAHSPARELIKSGEWFSQGFMIGIMKNTGGAVSAASSMAHQTMDAVNDAMSQMDDLIAGVDWDAQPTIRPVFDGSDVERGFAEMNAMLPQSDVYSASMIGAGSRAFGSADQQVAQQTTNTYNITLDWEAGMDANDMVMALSNALRSQTLMYA